MLSQQYDRHKLFINFEKQKNVWMQATFSVVVHFQHIPTHIRAHQNVILTKTKLLSPETIQKNIKIFPFDFLYFFIYLFFSNHNTKLKNVDNAHICTQAHCAKSVLFYCGCCCCYFYLLVSRLNPFHTTNGKKRIQIAWCIEYNWK